MLLLHLVNRVLAALVALALVCLAALASTEVVRWFVGEPSWLLPWRSWESALSELRADDPVLIAVAAGLAVLGLLLLVFELKPRPTSLESLPLLPGVRTVVTRKGLGSAAETAARSVSGIVAASSSVGRNRLDVTARTRAREGHPELRDRVRTAVDGALSDLALQRRPRVRVRIAEES